MKEELLKQWQKDVDDYGDNAYFMYGYIIYDKINNYESNDMVNNDLDEGYFGLNILRKPSAELPFDLERAKGRDDIECSKPNHLNFLSDRDFIDCDFVGLTSKTNLYEIKYKNGCTSLYWNRELRMKYPKKVNK